MAIIVRDSGGKFPPAPEGVHQAVCVDVIELLDQETAFGVKDQVRVVWQTEPIEDTDKDGNLTGKAQRYLLFKTYTASLNEKAALYKDLIAWRGRKFTPEELAGFDVEKLIGANCQVQIVHNIKENGKVYGNVQAVIPLAKAATKIQVEGYVRKKDREPEPEHDGGAAPVPDDDIPFAFFIPLLLLPALLGGLLG